MSPSVGSPLVLVVDDAPQKDATLPLLLADEGFTVEVMGAGEHLRAAINSLRPAVVLLDVVGGDGVAGGDGDGLSLLRLVRQAGDEPVIVLSSLGSPANRARGLELGADDYLAKPFDPNELAARIRAVLRRTQHDGTEATPLVVGELTIDFERRILSRAGTVVPLGRSEWLVLQYLAQNLGRVVLNTELLSAVWGDGYVDDLQVLRICMSRLRQKVGGRGRNAGPIKTIHNVGYALKLE